MVENMEMYSYTVISVNVDPDKTAPEVDQAPGLKMSCSTHLSLRPKN